MGRCAGGEGISKAHLKTSDPNDLELRILDPNISKSEAEWLAKGRIEQLEREVADALDCRYGTGPTALSMVLAERDQLLDQVVVQKKAIDALVKFGTTVAPSSSFWEESWVQHEEALAATEPTK